ncbi:MAG: hypothetical protein V4721_10620 [Bacteroidota bacterium]
MGYKHLILTDQEVNELIETINVALKTIGLPYAKTALHLLEKINNAGTEGDAGKEKVK